MSSNPDGHLDATPRFSPPQSAQPQGSLFGGPSRQDIDLEPYAEAKLEGDDEGQDEFDVMMRELPPIDNDLSDDESYRASDEEPGSNDAAGYRDANDEQPKREGAELSRATTRDQSSPPSFSSSSSSPPYRPNRFRGPASTWRHLTAGDRRNAEALETARSRDLAAHLYNAFALRERARAIASGNSGRTQRLDEAEFFDPGKLWTAWPMSASEVPRAGEHLRRQEGDGWTLRMQPDMRPSAELEENIIAIILRTAKERFETREWMSKDAAGHEGKEEAASFGDNGEAEGDEKVKSDPDSLDGPQFRPVVQADDDKSRRQLRPLTRNILTQFDGLLMGLHHARRGTMVMGDSSASEWQSDTESSVSRMSSRSKSPGKPRRREATGRSQSRGRKRARRSSSHASTNRSRSKSAGASMEPASTSESSSPDSSRPRGRSTGSKASTSRARLGLRDWSEVLGVASMTGWPSTVVNRAAQRCTGLFGQDMAFQTLKEGRVEQVPGDDGPKWEYIASESEGERGSIPPPPTRRSRSRGPSTHREPTPREASLAPEEERVVPRLKGKGEHRKQDLICPIKTCSRHKNGFTRRWNLNQHMKRMHPNYRPTKPGGIPPISVPTMDD
ncbi:hypothetical protein PHISP_01570 [Aspergillus sp. HF37]|nr:hypothetical protein PHISP_01570 [Aspergillus sp. HF37]